MFESLRGLVTRWLKIPDAPTPPSGSPGTLTLFQPSARYVRYKMVGWVIAHASLFLFLIAPAVLVPLLVVLAMMLEDGGLGLLALVLTLLAGLCMLAWVGLMVLTWVTVRMDRDLRWYMVTDRAVRIREGVWFVREMTLTFENIQNVAVAQGPLQRHFGLADVQVQTAGGGGGQQGQEGAGLVSLHTGFFRGVEDAPAIRDFLLERMRRARDSGLGDPDDRGAAAPRTAAGMSPAALVALREAAAQARALRQALETRR